MNRPARTSLAILLLLIFAPVSWSRSGGGWTKVQSKNFTLIGNADEREIRQVAARLEEFREIFSRLSGNLKTLTPVPTTVMVFRTEDDYRPYKPLYRGKPSDAEGFFQSGVDTNYIALSTEHRAGEAYRIIFHEYVHLLVNNSLGDVPIWFNEGLAEYYSTFETNGPRVSLGLPVRSHTATLREGNLLPLRTLFAVGQDSPYYNERDKSGIFYAESWALVHFLINSQSGAREQRLYSFVEMLVSGHALEEAFKGAFGADIETIEREFDEYVKRGDYRALSLTLPRKLEFDSDMTSAPISDAEALANLGDLLLHLKRTDDAGVALEQALKLDPDSAQGHCIMGMVRSKQGRFAEARKNFQRAVAANPSDYLLHYRYAYAVSREGLEDNLTVYSYTTNDAELMRSQLRKAIELRPDFPESYHLLAFVNLVRDEQLDESFNLIRRAIELAPGHEEFTLVLAQLYMRKQDNQSARVTLEPIATRATSRVMRERAQSLLNSIKNAEDYTARLQRSADDGHGRNAQDESQSARDAVADSTGLPTDFVRSLRRAEEGESQLRGMLVRVDCAERDGVIVYVRSQGRTLLLHSDELRHILFKTFTTEIRGMMSCGERTPANDVFITYRPAQNQRLKTEGEVVAIEFLPREVSLN